MSQDVLRRARGFERGNRRRARQDPNRTRRRLAGERVEVALVVGVLAARRRTQRIRRRGRRRRRNGRWAGPVQRLGTTGAGQVPLATPRSGEAAISSPARCSPASPSTSRRRPDPSRRTRAGPLWRSLTARRSSLSVPDSDVARWRGEACRRVRARVVASRHPRVQHPAIGFVQLADSGPLKRASRALVGDTRFRASTPVDARHPRPRSILVGSFAPSTARLFRSSPLERRPRASRAIGSRPPG